MDHYVWNIFKHSNSYCQIAFQKVIIIYTLTNRVWESSFPTLSSTVDIINCLMFSNYIGNNIPLDGFIFKLVIIKNFTYFKNRTSSVTNSHYPSSSFCFVHMGFNPYFSCHPLPFLFLFVYVVTSPPSINSVFFQNPMYMTLKFHIHESSFLSRAEITNISDESHLFSPSAPG